MTTAPSADVPVTPGTTVSLEYGSWFRVEAEEEEVAEVATPVIIVGDEEQIEDEGPEFLAIIGLVAIGLAILLMGVLIFILLRQQGSRSG